ncbi:MAG TPA: tripartite tricarboxylate transporter substrate binding protein [Thermodesulfobacteriota bacterium]|nr:tripartite tricarboxylate transporter substrate binding protein [Thermodesulfobacteriota bacterium]
MGKIVSVLVMAAVLFAGSASELFGQGYPNRPISLIIPMAPGDALDITGRLMGEALARVLKIPVVPLNKAGAGGAVGTDFVAKSKNDGYTLLMVNSASVISAKILHPEDINYDPFKDFMPLGLTTITPTVVTVRRDSPFRSLTELAEYSKKNPGKVRCATPGQGTLADLNISNIRTSTGADITMVPFKGASPAITALIGGHVEMATSAITPVIDHLRSGEARGLVISKRVLEFPNISTLKELGFQRDLFGIWFAFFAPAGIPVEVKEKLVPAIEKVVKDPTIISRMAKMGLIQEFDPPDKLFYDWTKEYQMAEEIAKKEGLVK